MNLLIGIVLVLLSPFLLIAAFFALHFLILLILFVIAIIIYPFEWLIEKITEHLN